MPRTESYRDALVIPTGNWALGEHRGHVFDGGICTSAGEPVRLAQHGHGPHRNETLPAGAIAPARRLGGRWLFGG